jgi:hypothetical protein
LVNVTDWKELSAKELTEAERARLLPVLEALEKILRPAFETLPHDAMPWTGSE